MGLVRVGTRCIQVMRECILLRDTSCATQFDSGMIIFQGFKTKAINAYLFQASKGESAFTRSTQVRTRIFQTSFFVYILGEKKTGKV